MRTNSNPRHSRRSVRQSNLEFPGQSLKCRSLLARRGQKRDFQHRMRVPAGRSACFGAKLLLVRTSSTTTKGDLTHVDENRALVDECLPDLLPEDSRHSYVGRVGCGFHLVEMLLDLGAGVDKRLLIRLKGLTLRFESMVMAWSLLTVKAHYSTERIGSLCGPSDGIGPSWSKSDPPCFSPTFHRRTTRASSWPVARR